MAERGGRERGEGGKEGERGASVQKEKKRGIIVLEKKSKVVKTF